VLDRLDELTTEMVNKAFSGLDSLSSVEIVKMMNDEDKKVAFCVEKQLEHIAKAIDLIVERLENGGRLFYFGAGTSGRLGVLDAAECPPTFGTDPGLVQGIIAGGPSALVTAIEGAEDDPQLGREDVRKYGVEAKDVVVGITASGRTPYVLGALAEARARHAATISLSCNENAEINNEAEVAINVSVGPEIVAGSTRLKAATAQKMVLNMLTTSTMIRLGKVYGNLMISVHATNYKLRERAKRIVMEVTGISYEEAEKLIDEAGGDSRIAIVMQKLGVDKEEAGRLLEQNNGRIRRIIDGR
jgi:N-acetylmuramic acid 6-phosphate etherase